MAGISSGSAGEVLAARFLRDKGYEIAAVNFHSRFGEIDIIARNAHYIVFVEVKTRDGNSLYAPREAVTVSKQRKIIKTAALYLQTHASDLQPRFDVVEVYTQKAQPMAACEIDHIQGAFEAGDLHEAF